MNPNYVLAVQSRDQQGANAFKSDPKVKSLLGLDSELEAQFYVKKEEFLARHTAELNEGRVSLGIHRIEGGKEKYFVCPESWFREDDLIGSMVVDLAKESKAVIKTVTMDSPRSKVFSKEFIEGVWFGLHCQSNLKRSRTKKDYELGRSCSFAMIVKKYFANEPLLGEGALTRDNFFFGNFPGEKNGRDDVHFELKLRCLSSFEDPKIGQVLFSFVLEAASCIGLSKLTDECEMKVVPDNIIPYDQILSRAYTSYQVAGPKGKIETRVRKPNPIRSSPLYFDKEISLIVKMTKPLFTDLDWFGQNYLDLVFKYGFHHLKGLIAGTVSERGKNLTRFSQRTKKRLQAIREMTKKTVLKKAEVSPEDLSIFLDQTRSPALALKEDIEHIVTREALARSIRLSFGKEMRSVNQASAFLYNQCIEVYKSMIPDHPACKDYKPDKSAPVEPSDIDSGRYLVTLKKWSASQGGVQRAASGFASCPDWKLHRRIELLEGGINKLEDYLNEISSASEIELKDALVVWSGNDQMNSWHAFRRKYVAEVANVLEVVVNAAKARQNSKMEATLKTKLGFIKKTIEDSRIMGEFSRTSE